MWVWTVCAREPSGEVIMGDVYRNSDQAQRAAETMRVLEAFDEVWIVSGKVIWQT